MVSICLREGKAYLNRPMNVLSFHTNLPKLFEGMAARERGRENEELFVHLQFVLCRWIFIKNDRIENDAISLRSRDETHCGIHSQLISICEKVI